MDDRTQVKGLNAHAQALRNHRLTFFGKVFELLFELFKQWVWLRFFIRGFYSSHPGADSARAHLTEAMRSYTFALLLLVRLSNALEFSRETVENGENCLTKVERGNDVSILYKAFDDKGTLIESR